MRPGSNLQRFHDGIFELNEKPSDEENPDDKFFDSRDYRICFNIFHAKIGTFVLCTLVFHAIILATIYLLNREFTKAEELTPKLVILLVCRLAQFISVAILYVGIWRHKRYLLLPFALIQITLGTFADISTLMMFLEDLERSNSSILFEDLKWLNLVIPLLIYMLLTLCLMWILYKCFIYFRARTAHYEKRKIERSQSAPGSGVDLRNVNQGQDESLI